MAAKGVAKHGIPWPVVVAPSDDQARHLFIHAAQIEEIPKLLLIDRKGILRAEVATTRDAEPIIAGLLAEQPRCVLQGGECFRAGAATGGRLQRIAASTVPTNQIAVNANATNLPFRSRFPSCPGPPEPRVPIEPA